MSDIKSNIVSLNAAVGRRDGAAGAAGTDGGATDPVSATLLRLHERIKPVLMRSVQTLFDHADDALFELADKAGSNGEQNLYFESMRELRIRRRGIELALGRDLLEGLRAFGRGAGMTPRAAVEEASADTLALISNDELEERVAIDGMVGKAEKEFARLLGSIGARLQVLVPASRLDVQTNPLGPAALCESFLVATRGVQLDIKARLVLFKLFDRHVIGALGDVYRLADLHLNEEGLAAATPSAGGRRPAAGGTAAGGAAGNAAGPEDAEQFFADLQQLLQVSRPAEAPPLAPTHQGLVAPGLAPALPRDALLQMLTELQRQQLLHLTRRSHVAPQPLDVLRAINDLLHQRLPGQAVSIGQVDDDAINLVAMLFQFVLEDRNLAAPVKGLIARLQIPVLKVAMVDKTFFSKGGHPARKLLNELANASLGWAPLGDIERDAFYRKVDEAVSYVANEYSGDVAVFERALQDFAAYVELERRRAALVEQRTIDAEDGRARSELARRQVEQVLAERIAARALPPVVRRLLDDGWSNVMFLVCLKEGAESDEWRQALATVDDLIASVAPVSDFDARARLLQLLPGLLKRLRSGLSKVGVSPYELEEMFDELERLHLDRLHHDEVRDLVSEPPAEVAALPDEAVVVSAAPLPEAPAPVALPQTAVAPTAPAPGSVAARAAQVARAVAELTADAVGQPASSARTAPPGLSRVAEMVRDAELPSATVGADGRSEQPPAAPPAAPPLAPPAAASEEDVPLLTDVVGAKAVPEREELLGVSEAPGAALDALERELAAAFGDDPLALEDELEVTTQPTAAVAAEAPSLAAAPADAGAGASVPEPTSESTALSRIDRLQVGGWVEFHQSEGRVMRCRLAAIIRATGKFIFVNRAGAKVAENNREGLATLYARGELTILDEGRLFDRALESVIGNLREMRERG